MEIPESRKKEVLNRLSRIEGQIRGVRKMIESDEPCEKVLPLLSAVNSAVEGVTKLSIACFFQESLMECQEQGEASEEAFDQLVNLLMNTKI